MMAVDSKLGETKLGVGANGATPPPPTNVAEGSGLRAKRTSSLMRSASSLPKVEHSLDEFIARANQTLVDVSQWGTADQKVKEDEEKRREQDAMRWKAAEQQMRESDAREQSLRRQLDGLQGKLAEAEARAAVAMSASSSGGMSAAAVAAHDRTIDELKAQIDQANLKMKQSEQKTAEVSKQLELAKTEHAARTAVDVPINFDREETTDNEAEARIALAEAKAAKALAAARAAAAGLTVSSADLAAIESGLVVPMQPERRTPWIAIMLAFAGGLGIMFLVWKFALSGGGAATTATTAKQPDPTPTPAPAVQPAPQQAAPAAPAAPAKPTVTPIDENPTPAPSAVDDTKKPTATPIDETPPKADVKADVKPEPPAPAVKKPAPAVAKPVAKPAPVVVKKAPAPAPAVKKDPPKTAPAKGQIEDPFATPAPKKPTPAPKKPEKPAGGIVDPFGG
jgi:hypothetical protein